MAKQRRYTDPYESMGDFKPLLTRLAEAGFNKPNCTEQADGKYKIFCFCSDGSNMLTDCAYGAPLMVYDALEDGCILSFWSMHGDIKLLGIPAKVVLHRELVDMITKKGFYDAFRRRLAD